MSSSAQYKAKAARLEAFLKSHNVKLAHSNVLHAVAVVEGKKNWQELLAGLSEAPQVLEDIRSQEPIHASQGSTWLFCGFANFFKYAAVVNATAIVFHLKAGIFSGEVHFQGGVQSFRTAGKVDVRELMNEAKGYANVCGLRAYVGYQVAKLHEQNIKLRVILSMKPDGETLEITPLDWRDRVDNDLAPSRPGEGFPFLQLIPSDIHSGWIGTGPQEPSPFNSLRGAYGNRRVYDASDTIPPIDISHVKSIAASWAEYAGYVTIGTAHHPHLERALQDALTVCLSRRDFELSDLFAEMSNVRKPEEDAAENVHQAWKNLKTVWHSVEPSFNHLFSNQTALAVLDIEEIWKQGGIVWTRAGHPALDALYEAAWMRHLEHRLKITGGKKAPVHARISPGGFLSTARTRSMEVSRSLNLVDACYDRQFR